MNAGKFLMSAGHFPFARGELEEEFGLWLKHLGRVRLRFEFGDIPIPSPSDPWELHPEFGTFLPRRAV
jgi:hypothetical protein